MNVSVEQMSPEQLEARLNEEAEEAVKVANNRAAARLEQKALKAAPEQRPTSVNQPEEPQVPPAPIKPKAAPPQERRDKSDHKLPTESAERLDISDVTPTDATPTAESLKPIEFELARKEPGPSNNGSDDIKIEAPGGKDSVFVSEIFGSAYTESKSLRRHRGRGGKTLPEAAAVLDGLRSLVGKHAVFLEVAFKGKNPLLPKWQELSYEDTITEPYVANLCDVIDRDGNIGVALGPVSCGLVTIDCDSEEFLADMLKLNPRFSETLRTHGQRGAQLWLRMNGDYPAEVKKLTTKDGKNLGEWRGGNGCQSVLWGIHPCGQRYKHVVDYPAIKGEFKRIKWPDYVVLPWLEQPARSTTSQGSKGHQDDADLDKRIRSYMATMPVAVSGQGGHDTTFKVACTLIQGWGLSVDEARLYLQSYNLLCQPPWSDKELEHKLADAIKEPLTRPYGFLRNREAQKRRKTDTPESGGPTQENEEIEAFGPIDWGEISSISSNSSGGYSQKAIFPADSILEDFYVYSITQSEGADCYIIGAILPVVAALLGRNVWVPWANGALYPNLFSLIVGPQGNMKSTSIELAELIAKGVFANAGRPHFLPHNYSPESLFDAYYQHPWRLLLCDDANATLIKWQNPHDGERLSANFLTLFDGKPLSEGFRRNRDKGKLDSQERWSEPTSTNIVFGVTFNACEFRGNTQRFGLQRRFLNYVAENKARNLNRPQPDGQTVYGLIKQFSFLTHLRGAFSWAEQSEKLFDQYKHSIDEQIRACDILDDRSRGRLTTACAWVAKIAMIFEAARLCFAATWMPSDPEIVPTSPDLVFHPEILQLAIDHVESCLEAARILDQVANRQSIAEQAQILLAYVRTKFGDRAKDGSIILNKTQITSSYAHNFSRRSDSPASDIYQRYIPQLIRMGEAKLLLKEGRKEIYAFRADA